MANDLIQKMKILKNPMKQVYQYEIIQLAIQLFADDSYIGMETVIDML